MAEIACHIEDLNFGRLTVFESLDSTHNYLKAMLRSPLFTSKAVACWKQFGGYGRRNRAWTPFIDPQIYVSACWEFTKSHQDLSRFFPTLSLVAALAVRGTAQSLTNEKIMIKWPNDLWVRDKKCGGILVDLVKNSDKTWQVMVGLGLNLGSTPENIPSELRSVATALLPYPITNEPQRLDLLKKILESIYAAFNVFNTGGFAPFYEEYQKCDALKHRAITVLEQGQTETGTAQGVEPDGSLCLQLSSGELKKIYSGTIRILNRV